MTWLEDRIDKFLEQNPEYAIELWNEFIGNEDNGALHTGRTIYPMKDFQNLFVMRDTRTSIEAMYEGIRNEVFCIVDKYVWLCEDERGLEPTLFESFDCLYPDYRNELAELIAEHRDAILDEAHKTQVSTELTRLLEPTFADKYLEVFGIDAIGKEVCPSACGFNMYKCRTVTCESCINAFWNSPYEREYNLNHKGGNGYEILCRYNQGMSVCDEQ